MYFRRFTWLQRISLQFLQELLTTEDTGDTGDTTLQNSSVSSVTSVVMALSCLFLGEYECSASGPGVRFGGVAQGVTENIHRNHGEENKETRVDREPR
jgi:hypothetical protein